MANQFKGTYINFNICEYEKIAWPTDEDTVDNYKDDAIKINKVSIHQINEITNNSSFKFSGNVMLLYTDELFDKENNLYIQCIKKEIQNNKITLKTLSNLNLNISLDVVDDNVSIDINEQINYSLNEDNLILTDFIFWKKCESRYADFVINVNSFDKEGSIEFVQEKNIILPSNKKPDDSNSIVSLNGSNLTLFNLHNFCDSWNSYYMYKPIDELVFLKNGTYMFKCYKESEIGYEEIPGNVNLLSCDSYLNIYDTNNLVGTTEKVNLQDFILNRNLDEKWLSKEQKINIIDENINRIKQNLNEWRINNTPPKSSVIDKELETLYNRYDKENDVFVDNPENTDQYNSDWNSVFKSNQGNTSDSVLQKGNWTINNLLQIECQYNDASAGYIGTDSVDNLSVKVQYFPEKFIIVLEYLNKSDQVISASEYILGPKYEIVSYGVYAQGFATQFHWLDNQDIIINYNSTSNKYTITLNYIEYIDLDNSQSESYTISRQATSEEQIELDQLGTISISLESREGSDTVSNPDMTMYYHITVEVGTKVNIYCYRYYQDNSDNYEGTPSTYCTFSPIFFDGTIDEIQCTYVYADGDKTPDNIKYKITLNDDYTGEITLYNLKCFINNTEYYTVTFYDWDNTVLDTQSIQKGFSAIAPTAPTREGYTFIGWDKSFTNVVENLEIYAKYEEITNDGVEDDSEQKITALDIMNVLQIVVDKRIEELKNLRLSQLDGQYYVQCKSIDENINPTTDWIGEIRFIPNDPNLMHDKLTLSIIYLNEMSQFNNIEYYNSKNQLVSCVNAKTFYLGSKDQNLEKFYKNGINLAFSANYKSPYFVKGVKQNTDSYQLTPLLHQIKKSELNKYNITILNDGSLSFNYIAGLCHQDRSGKNSELITKIYQFGEKNTYNFINKGTTFVANKERNVDISEQISSDFFSQMELIMPFIPTFLYKTGKDKLAKSSITINNQSVNVITETNQIKDDTKTSLGVIRKDKIYPGSSWKTIDDWLGQYLGVLSNLYVKQTGYNESVFINNYAYYEDYNTIFTKDILISISPRSIDNCNKYFTIRDFKYTSWLNQLKSYRKDGNHNDFNVNLELKGILKNFPTVFNFQYKIPTINTSFTVDKPIVVNTIFGTKYTTNVSIEDGKLYVLDGNGDPVIAESYPFVPKCKNLFKYNQDKIIYSGTYPSDNVNITNLLVDHGLSTEGRLSIKDLGKYDILTTQRKNWRGKIFDEYLTGLPSNTDFIK